MTDTSDLSTVHARAINRIDNTTGVLWPERLQCLEDRRFANIAGAQWEDGFGGELENIPKVEINKVKRGLRRIRSQYRKNRVTVDFRPDDKSADPETADTLDGLYRADEQACGAHEAYDNGAEEAYSGGIGAWRLRATKADEFDDEDERQRIAIEPIFDADITVFFDPNAKRQDKADARWAVILHSMTREAFEEDYGGEVPSSLNPMTQPVFDWYTPDVVYVGEYYEVELIDDQLLTFEHALVPQKQASRASDLDDDERQELLDSGWRQVATRRIKRRRIRKYLLSGSEVLKDEGYVAGQHIPIVPVYGERVYIQNIERCSGYVRSAKDPQRVYNIQIAKLTEIASTSPHEVPILTPDQVRGHEDTWSDGHIKRYPYRLVNPIVGADGTTLSTGPIGKVEATNVPTPLAALVQITGADIAEMTGASSGTDVLRSNVSEDAIDAVNERVDDEAFVYLDNFAQAMRRSGEIWLSMFREIADEDDDYAVLAPDGQQSTARLAEGFGSGVRNDIWAGKYKAVAEVGPSSSSRRDKTARSFLKMGEVSAAAGDTEMASAAFGMAMLNMDVEGGGDFQRWVRMRLVRNGVVDPTDAEAEKLKQEAANAPPDPNQQLAEAASQQALAEAEKARAGAMKTVADTELTKAKIVETLSGVEASKLDQILKVVSAATASLAQPPAPPAEETAAAA